MDEWDEMAQWLEKATKDPMADAVRGRVTVVSVSEPQGRARYQECRVELRAEAAGIPQRTVSTEAVFPKNRWPKPGDVHAARISPSHEDAIEVDWDTGAR
ncbi:hypothetical protein [Microbacterium aurantiacum]|uniref:hypothetical protein n=1 Tax=Microbacterium aurantiacum TaxID=162393 RepID=UPI003D706714